VHVVVAGASDILGVFRASSLKLQASRPGIKYVIRDDLVPYVRNVVTGHPHPVPEITYCVNLEISGGLALSRSKTTDV
jgi:hypothetical protein